MTEISSRALTLLRLIGTARDGLSWRAACKSLNVSTVEMKDLARELRSRDVVTPIDPMVMHPTLRTTKAGNELLERIGRTTPISTMILTLSSGLDESTESLHVVLSDGDGTLAEGELPVSSYMLAAIRYLLVLEPGSLSANTTTEAALRIGAALLPACVHCRKQNDRACGDCVRGVVEGRMADAEAVGGWVRLELRIEWPWTYVPWELAALDVSSRLVLDRRLSMVRRVGAGTGVGSVRPVVKVLLASASTDDEQERSQLAGELTTIRNSLSVCGLVAGSVTVEVMEGFTTAAELAEGIAEAAPSVIHLLGHGSNNGLTTAVATINRADAATALAQPGVDLVVLSSCFGATSFGADRAGTSLAWQVADKGVASVIAFEGSSEVSHSIKFAAGFYPELLASGSVECAVRAGRDNIGKGSAYEQFGQIVLFNA